MLRLGSLVAAVVVFVVAYTFSFATGSSLRLETLVARADVLTGTFPPESSDGRNWVWTGPRAELALPGLDRRIDWRWTAETAVWRPPGQPSPHVAVSVDGVIVDDRLLETDGERLDVIIPARQDGRGLHLAVDVTPLFVPSSGDTRTLGISLTSMRLEPAGWPWPPALTLVIGGLAAAAMAISLGVLGVGRWWLLVLSNAYALGLAWALARGLAAYVDYARVALSLTLAVGVVAAAAVGLVGYVRRASLSRTARLAVGVSAVAGALKLVVLLHPNMPVGDAVFHVHRFSDVLGGHFLFTSTAPGAFTFPYPILLYLVSAPFSLLVEDTAGRIALLRIMATAADVVAATLMYWMVVRTLADARTALVAVVAYHAIPVTGWIMTWSNLSNAFAQPLAVMALALVVALPVDRARPRTVTAVTVMAALAMLGHPSTFATLAAVLAATALLYYWRGGRDLAGSAYGVMVAAMASGGLAVALYYGWFISTYTTELPRIAADATARAADGGTPMATRLSTALLDATRFIGVPALIAAALALPALTARHAGARRLTLLIAAWLAAFVVFQAVGLATPVALRSHFAVFPAVALAASLGLTWAWQKRGLLRLGAVGVGLAGLWAGLRPWLTMLAG
ncbi:MAG TPA: hypothetical protein VLA20_06095 [Vicinamibacterales bacterium]|nr:hypothetical protein [Vicinamibacterales bacterium]